MRNRPVAFSYLRKAAAGCRIPRGCRGMQRPWPNPGFWPRAGLAIVLSCRLGVAAPSPAASLKVDYDREVRPILSQNCYKCHGPDDAARKANLRFDLRGVALQPAKSGLTPIVPGAPDKSELVARLTALDPKRHMPPPDSGKKLNAAQVETLRSWVAQGAPYAMHWAYVKPTRPALPEVMDKTWPRNPVDRFILARIEQQGLKPSPPADRATLIRRVSLDLTGLPPTPGEMEAFINDKRPGAYERLVDRLLASSAYGEHWARMWLDLARYADSAGYADDPPRVIWAYRDYVIKSFNCNKPFDQFSIEQIAGDLLPDATEEDQIATAFHRNTMTNHEGGTDREEFRNAAIVDRVNTTMAVWMATSMACAQCHHHKFDPISQQEYFRLFAIFNNTEDADRSDEAPVLELPTPEQKQEQAKLRSELAQLEKELGITLDDPGTNQVPADLKPKQERLAQLRKQLADIRPNTVPIMRELTGDKRRQTHVQIRGNFRATAEEVTPGVPAVFPPLPKGAAPDRLGLARWLVDEDNPLTGRVIANRFWEQIFGTGIARTSEDFGSQGDLPTHPELLDWLATELLAQKWDIKAFLRLLVTSATYCQSSRVTPELLERDPDNLLLARGPRFRLTAEEVRDQALFASGLLSRKMYGPPVRPPSPSLGLSAAFGGSLDWSTSEGEDRYRRAIYIDWRRTSLYPSLATFDAPSREICALRRPRSNTPLQALVTLNDPVYIEAAQALARRMAQAPGSVAAKAGYGFRLCLARQPHQSELGKLTAFFDESRADYARTPQKAQTIATKPLGPAPEGIPIAELAAWTVVANVLLNLDETLMKP